MNTWTKLEDGTWGAKLQRFEYGSTGRGFSVTLKNAAGRKTTVRLGDHVKTFRIKGGTIVQVYRIATEEEIVQIEAEWMEDLKTRHEAIHGEGTFVAKG